MNASLETSSSSSQQELGIVNHLHEEGHDTTASIQTNHSSLGTHRLGFRCWLFILTPWAGYEIVDEGWPQFNWEIITGIVFLAVFSTVIAYVWFAEGIRTIGAAKSALYVYLVPPFGILGGVILIGEKLGLSLLVAFVLIVGGVAIAQSDKHDEAQATGTNHGD